MILISLYHYSILETIFLLFALLKREIYTGLLDTFLGLKKESVREGIISDFNLRRLFLRFLNVSLKVPIYRQPSN